MRYGALLPTIFLMTRFYYCGDGEGLQFCNNIVNGFLLRVGKSLVISSISMSEMKEDEYAALHHVIFNDDSRSIFNGYGGKSVPKLFDMVSYIVMKHGEVFPTKLNKLMFYADFNHYRKTGQSISGLQYRALNFGPVPDHYATIYDNTPELDKRLIEAHDMVSTLLSCNSNKDYETLSDSGLSSLKIT
mgnify:CR=1 FL=1